MIGFLTSSFLVSAVTIFAFVFLSSTFFGAFGDSIFSGAVCSLFFFFLVLKSSRLILPKTFNPPFSSLESVSLFSATSSFLDSIVGTGFTSSINGIESSFLGSIGFTEVVVGANPDLIKIPSS